MRVAVIGCGSAGRRHIANLLALGCDVYAYDPDRQATERARTDYPGARLVDGIGDAEHFDGCVVASPYDQHLSWVEQAIRTSRPFLVEKPLGSLEQLPRWQELAAMDLPINQVGYQQRFQANARALHAAITPAKWVDCRVDSDMRLWPGRSYGHFLLEMSHEIDIALWCGAGDVLSAELDTTTANITFEHGQVRLNARADKYFLEWSGLGKQLGYQWCFDAPEERGDQMYVDEMKHFLECVHEQKQTLCPLADGLRVLEVCQAAEALAKVRV